MIADTWNRLAAEFQRRPGAVSGPVTSDEVEHAERQMGLPFPPDYREFLLRYGGAIVEPVTLYGIRPSKSMASGETVVAQNRKYHGQGWPGLNPVLVISSDGSGNPIGIGPEGRIWRSDHNGACVYDWMADSFEDLVRGCLGASAPSVEEDLRTVDRRIAEEQQMFLTTLGVHGHPATLEYDNIWVEASWDALDAQRVVLTAVPPPRASLRPVNMWHLAPQGRQESTPDDHYLALTTLWRQRPGLVKVLALPTGFRAYFDGNELQSVFDPAGRQVWPG